MLNDTKIKSLKPDIKKHKVADGEGLSLTVYPSGKKTWYARYRVNGMPQEPTLGHYPDMTLADARAKLREIKALLARGDNPIKVEQSNRKTDAMLF